MTGKGRELADMMERRKMDILCVQETRGKGSKARSIGAGFKLFYYGVDSKRNGVGVVLKEEFVRNVLEVKRVSDRVMSLKLEIEGVMLNVVSGYAPQVGCELEEKEKFWSELDEVMESIPMGERVVIGADFNGHVGEGNTGDEEVMGKFGVKERNLEGQMKLRQALGDQVVLPDDWESTAEVIRETGRKVCHLEGGKKIRRLGGGMRKLSIQRKRLAKKKWDLDRTEENRQEYKELQHRVKREVSKAKKKAYDELYIRLDTREGEKDLYSLARQRDRDGKDVQQVSVIKDRDGRVLTSEDSVQRRWKEYFEELMNEENEREKRVEGVNSVEQKVDKIRKDEVRKALKRMKKGKAFGPDNILVEIWNCLGEAAVEFLTRLFNRVLENLEKAYDRVPREELWYCMRKSGVAENVYERSRTVVRYAVGQTEEFKVEVGLHQGSALSPFLFAIVMDQLSEEVRQESPWTMMSADDIVICSESRWRKTWRSGGGKPKILEESNVNYNLSLSSIYAVHAEISCYNKFGPNSMDSSSSPPDPLQDLVAALRQALAALRAPAPTPPATTSIITVPTPSALLCASPMAQPAPYSGLVEDCNGFLLQCSLVLEMQPHRYPTERSKVAFIITQLSGKALLWAQSLWSQNHPAAHSYAGFIKHFKEVFGKPSWDSSISENQLRSPCTWCRLI
ncbi:hypothetical protein QTP70_028820 [Hemibagrus guttatus]|uniref:Reverse transcriptase domain-containing protein n=1 Tax=Hemibagrus guttatus TaxID=175788 RepID=A0AAE0Q4L7_9TELE|nr:hypothetical protein QTP70_028820 [Hemibagrus guttatus]